MRIAFICGSLEKGKDGVGDYSRELSVGLSAMGNSIICIALNDPYISQSECASRMDLCASEPLPAEVRYSASSPYRLRFENLRNLIHSASPEWISLQFVPYAYAASGIPWKFAYYLSALTGEWSWHLMFHELWIGDCASPKRFIVSLCQKQVVKNVVEAIRPAIIHTSISRYVNLLKDVGLASSILPIHSNIRPSLVAAQQVPNQHVWTFVFFGTLDPQWQSEPFFGFVEAARRSAGIKTCRFVRIGSTRNSVIQLWMAISNEQVLDRYPSFEFIDYGHLPADQVSDLLGNASFGVSMAPLQWIGKSGSVAAMLDHGLPVLVPHYRVSFDPPDISSFVFADQLILIDSELPDRLRTAVKVKTNDSLSRTMKTMLTAFLSN